MQIAEWSLHKFRALLKSPLTDHCIEIHTEYMQIEIKDLKTVAQWKITFCLFEELLFSEEKVHLTSGGRFDWENILWNISLLTGSCGVTVKTIPT